MGMYNDKPLTEFGLACEPGSSRTKQSFRDECDINRIISRFEKTGMIESLNGKTPFYGDVSDLVGYQDALNVVSEAEALFMSMSAEVRDRFSNDPSKMIAFLSDVRNKDEAIKMGMVIPEPINSDVVPTGVASTPVDAVVP